MTRPCESPQKELESGRAPSKGRLVNPNLGRYPLHNQMFRFPIWVALTEQGEVAFIQHRSCYPTQLSGYNVVDACPGQLNEFNVEADGLAPSEVCRPLPLHAAKSQFGHFNTQSFANTRCGIKAVVQTLDC